MSFRLPKEERLYHRKQIDNLFSKGKSIKQFPLKLLYVDNLKEEKIPLKILISVPKRNFKKAVIRNRIKRLIKESYRIQKPINSTDIPKAIGIIYMGKDTPDFDLIDSKMKILLSEYQELLNS